MLKACLFMEVRRECPKDAYLGGLSVVESFKG